MALSVDAFALGVEGGGGARVCFSFSGAWQSLPNRAGCGGRGKNRIRSHRFSSSVNEVSRTEEPARLVHRGVLVGVMPRSNRSRRTWKRHGADEFPRDEQTSRPCGCFASSLAAREREAWNSFLRRLGLARVGRIRMVLPWAPLQAPTVGVCLHWRICFMCPFLRGVCVLSRVECNEPLSTVTAAAILSINLLSL